MKIVPVPVEANVCVSGPSLLGCEMKGLMNVSYEMNQVLECAGALFLYFCFVSYNHSVVRNGINDAAKVWTVHLINSCTVAWWVVVACISNMSQRYNHQGMPEALPLK
jgi:hypothetical protein